MPKFVPKIPENNLLFLSDSYKHTQPVQYPPDMEVLESYLESRGGQFNGTIFFGLQYIIKKHFMGAEPIGASVINGTPILDQHFGGPGIFNPDLWKALYAKHGNNLPISIRAVPEGTYVPTGNVMMVVRSTDPDEDYAWLTNYLETVLTHVWYPTTVATNSNSCRGILAEFLRFTGDIDLLDWKLHDFGFRGVSCVEQAMIGGMAHLTQFNGTDTLAALVGAINYYNADGAVGGSIPASEHSTITSWGRQQEPEAMANMLQQFKKGAIACVSDSYNIFKACSDIWGGTLKEEIMGRDGTLVARPDSGDPPTVVVKVLLILWDKFGGHINKKGYKVLDPHIRVIQGDGIDRNALWCVLAAIKNAGFSADNVAFGSGGGLLQKFDRDTCKFAFKASWVKRSGVGMDVYKEPITDHGKNSKRGELALQCVDGIYSTVLKKDLIGEDQLIPIYENGELLEDWTWEEVVQRGRRQFHKGDLHA